MAAEVSLGWNNDKLLAGSKQAEAIVQRTSQQMQKSLSKASGGGAFRGIGQASLQLQDVAVQLQGGAKATTVIAQQVPQLLGAFGAGGAIVGGLVAVGAGLYGMADAAVEAFRTATAASKGFEGSLTRLLTTASPLELADQYNAYKKTAEDAQAALDKGVTYGQVFSQFKPGAAGISSQLTAQNRTRLDAIQGMESIEARLIQLGQQNLDLTSLRANGKAAEADELQRQIDLSTRLFQIQQSQFSDETKATLTNQAIAASAAAARASATAQAFADTQKLIDAQNKLEDLKRSAALESASIYDREKLLKQEIATEEENQAAIRADFVPDQMALIRSEERMLRLKQDLLRTQKMIADEVWRVAEIQDKARADAIEAETAKININGTIPPNSDKVSTKAKQSARESNGLSGFYESQNRTSQFQELQRQASKYEQSQQGMSAFQRLQLKSAQDRAAGPVMPMPAPAANTPPAASDPRPIVQAIQALPEDIANRLLA